MTITHYETQSSISNELHAAFRETRYKVNHTSPFTLHIGQSCPELDALLKTGGQDSAVFLTAWNPVAQPLGEEENRRRQAQLADELQRRCVPCVEGIGQHPSNGWSGEESTLALGLQPEEARALCAQFGQLACVLYRLGQPAQLLIA